jgi:hypothetical protein
MTNNQDPAPHPLLKYVAENSQTVGYALLTTAAALIVLTVMAVSWWLPDYKWPLGVGGFFLVLATGVAGLERLLRDPRTASDLDGARIMVLVLGGIIGLGMTVTAGFLAYAWWSNITAWLDETGPKEYAWRAIVAVLVPVAGLAIMFSSLQLARTQERSYASLRRLLYGYNAVLTLLLIVVILAVTNVFLAVKAKSPLDFTASANYTLSSQSINVLKALDKPVEIYQIPGFNEGYLEDEVKTLLSNLQSVNSQVQFKEIDLDIDQQRARELAKKYPGLERGSVLVVFNPGETNEDSRIILEKELTQMPEGGFGRSAPSGHKFTGEDAVLSVLSSLTENKKKMVVYFTQGNGELDLSDSMPSKLDVGAGVLKKRLEERKSYEIKPLKLDPVDPKVPEDAALVIIAGPRIPLAENAVNALRTYMKKKGRLLVLLDPIIGPDKKMLAIGLEELLAEYSVQAPPQRLLSLPSRIPGANTVRVFCRSNPALVQSNPLARLFDPDDLLPFDNTRPLVVAVGPPGGQRTAAQPLLLTLPMSFADSNFEMEPSQVVADITKNEKTFREKVNALKPEAIAAIVTESSFDPNDPHAMMRGGGEQKPRMVVFGSASMACNRNMDERRRSPYFDLIANSIEWLREKESLMGIPPKKRDTYELKPKTETEYVNMVFSPLMLIVACMLGLATGVWLVRRR